MLTLSTDALSMLLHEPGDGFYAGTRFDRGGVFASLLFHGVELCGPWFTKYDPLMHDAVQGPAEEFSPVWLPAREEVRREMGFSGTAPKNNFPAEREGEPQEAPTEMGFSGTAPKNNFRSVRAREDDRLFIKIGVGLLRLPDESPYDRFRLYEIIDPGRWEAFAENDRAVFRHVLDGWYDYRKEIVLTGADRFEIRHTLASEVPLEGEVYNHNFFTFGRMAVGPAREIDLPFVPAGDWRAVYDSVGFTPTGIRFSRPLAEGESVYCGNLHAAGRDGMPYDLLIRETAAPPVMPDLIGHPPCHYERSREVSIHITGDVPVTHTVLWANHRIACLEPYNVFRSVPGTPCRWTVRYHLSAGD